MAQFRTTIFTTVLLLIAGGQAASRSDVVKCPENEYYDHGVESCEPCTDICQDALYKRTVEDCRELCPAVYAIMVSDKLEKPALELPEASRDDPKPPRSIASAADPETQSAPAALSTPTIAGIIAVVVLALVLVVGVVAFAKRRRQTGRRGRNDVRHNVVVVQEENGEQAEGERRSQATGLLGGCDPREWFGGAAFLAEETTTGRWGGQELALLGSSHGSQIQESSAALIVVDLPPIYRPSGSMRSSRV